MGGNRTGCSGCLTILILLFALGLMSEAWQGARPAADPAGHRHQRNGGEPGVEMRPRPHAIAVMKPGDQLAATAATAPTPHLRTHMDPQPWPTLGLHLDGHDHDLTAQPEDRSKYLANAHAVPFTSTDLVPRQPTFALFDDRWLRPGARGTSSAIVYVRA
jgi:hypothetical protein